MPLFKNIPNFFTLLNLIFGCVAIFMILQTGQSIVMLDEVNAQVVMLPERIWQGALFIFAAAVVDFLDGFLARLMKAQSEMGKQLDSLSDVVSFGVAPGMILFQLLRMAYAQKENGLDVAIIALVPAFIFTAAVAWRLARFNISTNQSSSFRGVPSPAAGLVVASLPLIVMAEVRDGKELVTQYLFNEWVLYGIILLLSWLMLSGRRFLALKFKSFGFSENMPVYLLAVLSIIAIVLLGWLSVPVIFLLYVVFSIFVKEKPVGGDKKAVVDVTV